MKKIFLLATAAILVLASCTKTQIIETPADQKAISFENFIHKATKATPVVAGNVQTQTIKVYSYLMNALSATGTGANFFNDNLTYTAPDWKAGTKRYWPLATTTSPATQSLSFFAYLPSGSNGLTNYSGDNYILDATARPTFNYTVPAVADQEDLMVASKLNLTNVGGAYNTVAFDFKHALSQIAFSVAGQQNDNLTYTVKEITISGLANTATYTLGTTDAAGVWGATTGDASYTYDGGNVVVNGSTPTSTLAANALMLMPQTLGGTAKITVKYYVEDNAGNAIYGTDADPVVKEKAISGSWTQTNRYVYAITIPAGNYPIEYTVSISQDWIEAGDTDVAM